MAWTAPMTAVTGNVHTAAEFNLYWRDNLLATETVATSTTGNLLVATGAHAVAQRLPAVAFTSGFDSTTSTAYTGLTASTSVTAETGQWALISLGGYVYNDTAGTGSRIGFAASGATTVAAADANSFLAESGNLNDGYQGTWTTIYYPLNAGLHIFDLKYKTVFAGATATFGNRLLAVVPF